LSINWLKEGINCLGASYPIDASEYPQAGLIIFLSIFQGEVVQKPWNSTVLICNLDQNQDTSY